MAATTKLTATGVRALVKKPGKYGDGDGLWLHVSKPGRAHWHLHYGPRTGQRVMSLGSVDQVSLAEARELAGTARKLIVKGIDPLDQRREHQAAAEIAAARAVTFAEAVDAYIASHEAGWRNPKHRYQWRATLDRANEVMGSTAVAAIDTEAVLRVLTPIWQAKSQTAARLRERIEKVPPEFAIVQGWREGSQPGGLARAPATDPARATQGAPDPALGGARLARGSGVHGESSHASRTRRRHAGTAVRDPDRDPLRRNARRDVERDRHRGGAVWTVPPSR